MHNFPYHWTLADATFTKDKGKVFSCFACGGGSTMGYKLAGFDVIGCNEIDPKMMDAYKANHNPKFAFLEPIQTFKLRKDLPRELYELDILDGSPPCSSFSLSGNREKDWGKEKKFREGQAMQVLDNLFFDFIDLAKELQPKIVVAENVKGLLQGGAKSYVRQIYRDFDLAGYYCQHFLLDASKMGVPQRRERVFFIALRKDLATPFLEKVDLFCIQPELKMEFKEPRIKFGEFALFDGRPLSAHCKKAWDFREKGDRSIAKAKARAGMKVSDFNNSFVYQNEVLSTITGKGEFTFTLFDKPIYISANELIMGGTFPNDYDFQQNKPGYLIGMSVPPVMVAQIATQIWEQWIYKIN